MNRKQIDNDFPEKEKYIIEGRNSVFEALRSGRAIDKVIYAEGDKNISHILAAAKNGILYAVGAVLSNDILNQRLETTVLCRHSLCSYDSDFFHFMGVANCCL